MIEESNPDSSAGGAGPGGRADEAIILSSSQWSGLSFPGLTDTNSLWASESFLCAQIHALDMAGRKDLSIPLKAIADRMWARGVDGVPNPAVLRYLERRAAEAWAVHASDQLKRAGLIAHLRDLRLTYVDYCFVPGMTFAKLREEAKWFWPQLQQSLEEKLSGRAG